MWSDNDTNRDFLNFSCVADTVAEMIVQAKGQPLSMGVSGGWGIGKTTMLNLISDALRGRGEEEYLFVEFNAWLYQGYDDARAALMDVIASKLIDHAESTKTGLDRAKDLLRRVKWLRVAGLAAGSAVSIAAGLPPVGALGTAWTAAKGLADGEIVQEDVDAAMDAGKAVVAEGKELLRSREEYSPPKQIHDLREHFAKTLREMKVTLVVSIDDLDRCLPETAIATLEAIRLFLFLPNTAFVIAADDRMIREAVRAHFKDATLDDDLVTNYFDKLVQIPLRVPPLGTQEVRAYLMLLFVENSSLEAGKREAVRQGVCERLSESWKGLRVDARFLTELIGDGCPPDLRQELELADRLAPLMTTAKAIAGNPRLIKRFLNTLSIRLSIARAQHVSLDESALAKMLLFERCASKEAYTELVAAINEGNEGRPTFLAEWERLAQSGEALGELPPEWTSDFSRDWLALQPAFAQMDLRGVVYVSREHMPVITPSDQLSSVAAGLLEGLMILEGQPSSTLAEQLRTLPGREIALVVDRVLIRARQEQEWGTPSALWALLTVLEADEGQASTVTAFLATLQPTQLRPDIVPVLGDREWARSTLSNWSEANDTPQAVKNAIRALAREEG